MDIDLEHFGIAKYVQDKYDCEIFAVIDINNKTKNFFLEQKIIKFKKTWFYRDYILKLDGKPDLEYLAQFERKYNINLWSIAYTERYFVDYNPYYKFNSDEILYLLETECRFFENVLDEINPDFLIIKVTDYHQNHLFHQICKARGIKILMYGRTRMSYRAMISQDCDVVDTLQDDSMHETTKNRTIDELQNIIKGYSYQQHEFRKRNRNSSWTRIKAGLKFLIFVCNNDYRKFYANYGRTRFKVLINEIMFVIKRIFRESFINKNAIKIVEKNTPFVYFPLHLEPERAVLIAAPYYTNQLEVIRNIAKSLPVEFLLYVKDHPGMRDSGWRNISFYKKILELPNVKLIHHSVSNDELIKNCSLVVTIAGTAGMEAAFYQKPSIVLVDTIFSPYLPSVYRVRNIEDLPEAISLSLNRKVNLDDLNNYVSFIDKNSFQFDYFSLQANIGDVFFHGGFLKDVYISTSQMNEFLQENKKIFEILADEHISKINQYKKYKINTKNN